VTRADGGFGGVPPVGLRWERREPPLTAGAVVGFGPVAGELAVAVGEAVSAGARPSVAGDADVLVVLGEAGELPWADGARYLGWEDGILVPTTARPVPSAALWRDALTAHDGSRIALLPDTVLLFQPAPARGPDGAHRSEVAP